MRMDLYKVHISPAYFCGEYYSFWAACTNFQDKLKERERELRKRKEREEQEMERVRLKVRRKEAVSSYQALLVETIKDPQVVSYYSNVLNLDGLAMDVCDMKLNSMYSGYCKSRVPYLM